MSDYIVSSGEVASGVSVGSSYYPYYNTYDYENLFVSSGGTANSATVGSCGSMFISNGGVANGTTVSSGGWLYVSNGGVANSTTVTSGGGLAVYSGGTANNTTVNNSGDMYVADNGTANSVTLSGGGLDIYSGGTANRITVSSGGYLFVYSGGTATNITWTPFKGRVDWDDGAKVTFANKLSGVYYGYRGMMGDESRLISKAQSMNSKTLSADTTMYVMSGGTVNSTTVKPDAFLEVWNGGVANNTTVKPDGHMFIYSGGRANNTTLIDNDIFEVCAGGVANNVTVKSGGGLWVGSGGTATNISWTPCVGTVGWDAGAKVTFTKAINGVYLGYGDKLVSHAATMSSKTLVGHEDKAPYYYQDDDGEEMCVMSGGKANNITLMDGSYLKVYSGGVASGINIKNYSTLTVINGGVARNVKCDGWGDVNVNAGGIVSNLTLSNGGEFDLDSGGIIRGLTIYGEGDSAPYDCMFYFRTGGKITGRTRIYSGAVIEAKSGAIIDFDLTMMSPEDAVLMNNLAAFHASETDDYGNPVSKPGAVYTLTVNGSQSNGTYKLAGGASGFNKTISVVNTSGSKLGTLSVGKSVTISGKTYQLNLSGSSLTVAVSGKSTSGGTTTVDKTAPTVSNVKANTTAATNKDVTVTATFSDNVAVSKKLYKIGNGSWKSYSNGVTVSKNDTVSFKAVDASGNESKVVTYKVTNIDKTAPAKPTSVKANITKTTNQAVTVTASFSKDSTKKQYSLDNKSWSTYSNGVKVTKNGTVYFRGIDAAGNISPVVSYKVSNIDTTPPTKPTAKANITSATNQAVTVTATFSKDSDKKQYSLDNKKWSNYSNGVKLTKNGTVYFRGIDAAGNISTVATYKVSNIDTTAPTKPTTKANITKTTDQAVTVTATFSKDSEKKQYSLDNKKWSTYSNGVKFTKNGTVYFRGIDAAGNISQVASYKVSNIQSTVKTSGKTVASVKNADAIIFAASEQPAASSGIGAEWEMLATADFNADGKDDTLWRNSFIGDDGSWYSAYCTKLATEENDWRMVDVANAEEWNFLGSGDFDGDGTADIAIIGNDGVVGIWGVQDGGMSSWSILSAVTPEWSFSGIADFNADGTDDIAWSNPETGLAGFWQIENKELASWHTASGVAAVRG